MILKTQGVSFPRSGFEALYHVLQAYFEGALVFCDANSEMREHCGCGSVPCVNPRTNYSKNHDFDVVTGPGIAMDPSWRCLVQYRNPVRSIVSNYYLHRMQRPDDTSRQGWEKFAQDEIEHWCTLIEKWVLGRPDPAVVTMHCPYDDLVGAPREMVRRAVQFICTDPVDERRLTAALKKVRIAPRNRMAKFEFYDDDFFHALEARAVPIMKAARLATYQESY